MVRSAIALGSNISPRKELLRKAVEHLENLEGSRIMGKSQIYETAPVGPGPQAPYLNSAAKIFSGLIAVSSLFPQSYFYHR